MSRNIESITEKEIDNVFKISGIKRIDGNAYFDVKKITTDNLTKLPRGRIQNDIDLSFHKGDKDSEVLLEDGYGAFMKFSDKGVFYKQGYSSSEEVSIPNGVQVAQYLIDQGFKFEYNLKD